MNQHLNIFRYFNESQISEFIENNLSRAFAICLQNDVLFFNQYIQAIIEKEDYDYLFTYFEKETKYTVDIQINTNVLELSDIRKVYAIAMTADHKLNMDDFLNLKPRLLKEMNNTDVWILIKDIALVIEVKRGYEDCKQQLYDQIVPFLNAETPIEIKPKNFSWEHTVRIMEQVSNIQKLKNSPSYFIEDFLNLSEVKYPGWFSSKPFYLLPPLSDQTNKSFHARNIRLKQIINHSNQVILDYSDRMAISVNFGWASEVIAFFQTIKQDDYIVFTIWPGNTKAQGYNIYNKNLNWVNKNSLTVDAQAYELDTDFHLKFCHFNKYITSINFKSVDLQKPLNTPDNFYRRSGKWNLDRWPEFEIFMNDHFKPEYKWKDKCGWDKHFGDTDRSYFTVSFGFEVDLYVPFKRFQSLDKNIDDYSSVARFIDQMIESFGTLLN